MTSLHHNVTVLMPLHVEQRRKETIQPQTREGNLVAKRVRSSGRRFRTAHSCVQMDLMDLPVYVVPACSCWLKLPLKWRRANYTSVLEGQLERQGAPNSCALRSGVECRAIFSLTQSYSVCNAALQLAMMPSAWQYCVFSSPYPKRCCTKGCHKV